MRGKADLSQLFSGFRRITPAYAGKSQIVVNFVCGKQDHPRLCGEKVFRIPMRQTFLGSPPPMRGKGRIGQACTQARRITPAYAGKSYNNMYKL